jgi:hypothetical protein
MEVEQMNKVVLLNTYRTEKQYQQYGSCVIDLSMDTTYPVKKEQPDYARQLTDSYIKLLTNYINK